MDIYIGINLHTCPKQQKHLDYVLLLHLTTLHMRSGFESNMKPCKPCHVTILCGASACGELLILHIPSSQNQDHKYKYSQHKTHNIKVEPCHRPSEREQQVVSCPMQPSMDNKMPLHDTVG